MNIEKAHSDTEEAAVVVKYKSTKPKWYSDTKLADKTLTVKRTYGIPPPPAPGAPPPTPVASKFKDLKCICRRKTTEDLDNYMFFTKPVFEPVFSDTCCISNQELPKALPKEPDVAMLTAGFGIRNASSLDLALAAQKPSWSGTDYTIFSGEDESLTMKPPSFPVLAPIEPKTYIGFLPNEPDQIVVPPNSMATLAKEVGYRAMGPESERVSVISEFDEDLPEFDEEPNVKIKRLKSYLKNHRVFEFFSYLSTMVVVSRTDNPITFLLNLLDKILLYRCGLGIAPVLYDKVHIEQLFNLMDRMGTGYVDEDQYVTAMHTLGICSYNRSPLKNCEGLIAKETFIEEVFDAEIQIFNDVIRRRVHVKPPPPTMPMKDFLSQAEPEGESLDAYKIEDTGADRTSHPIDDTTLSFTDLSAAI